MAIEMFWLPLNGDFGFRTTLFRYSLLRRTMSTANKCGGCVLAFAFEDDGVWFLFEAPTDAIGRMVRGIKVGTIRHGRTMGVELAFGDARRELRDDPRAAILELHGFRVSASGPLVNPWTSHRDLMQLRFANFIHTERVRQLGICAKEIHEALGGEDLDWPPDRDVESEIGTKLNSFA